MQILKPSNKLKWKQAWGTKRPQIFSTFEMALKWSNTVVPNGRKKTCSDFNSVLLFYDKSKCITNVVKLKFQRVPVQKLWEQTGHTVEFHLLHKIPKSRLLYWLDLWMCVNSVCGSAAQSIWLIDSECIGEFGCGSTAGNLWRVIIMTAQGDTRG